MCIMEEKQPERGNSKCNALRCSSCLSLREPCRKSSGWRERVGGGGRAVIGARSFGLSGCCVNSSMEAGAEQLGGSCRI